MKNRMLSNDDGAVRDNYIYRKICEGYDYIVSPRGSGKSMAVAVMCERHGFVAFNCLMSSNVGVDRFLGKDDVLSKDVVFDEFEFLEPERQVDVLGLVPMLGPSARWVFVTSRRNTRMNDLVNKRLEALESEGRIRICMITERKMMRIRKTLSL